MPLKIIDSDIARTLKTVEVKIFVKGQVIYIFLHLHLLKAFGLELQYIKYYSQCSNTAGVAVA